MRPAITLFGDALDFAGRYPPARLPAAETIASHGRLMSSAPWFAGRLVWPVEDLDTLSDLAEGVAPTAIPPRTEGAWAISVVTRPVASDDFRFDLDTIAEFNEGHAMEGAAALCIDSLEAKVDSAREIDLAIEAVPDDVFPYLEIGWGRDPRGLIAALAGVGVGAKLRMGGMDAAAHPPVEAVARFMVACARAEVPFKATAGMHRALRHAAPAAGCDQHGFLNVFAAAALLQAGELDEQGVSTLLDEREQCAIALDEAGLSWKGIRASMEAIQSARRDLLHSWGSCSWEEPMDDLRSLGWIDREVVA